MIEASERVRLNLAVTPRVKARLEDLLRRTEAESITEVVRRSLAIYEHLVDITSKGGKVILESDSGEQRELQLVW